jgi:Na+-translocating ferredoxin:NAD+ oxidoreductase RnfD subunit
MTQAARRRRSLRAHLLTALLFGLAAAATRVSLPDTKTRYQIIAFLGLALLLELARAALRQRPSISGLALNASAIIFAAVAVKIAMEGRPHLPMWVSNLAAAAGFRL